MTESTRKTSLGDLLGGYAEPVESALRQWLSDPSVPESLAGAMRYAVLDGGKRLRPALVMMSAEAVADRPDWPADPSAAAAAIELVHGYSLVHDDLPAMDNDTLRRGRPTVHVKFGQAMAILVGDALLTLAFEIIARGSGHDALAARLAGELARAAGPAGMVGGQAADMDLCRVPSGENGLRYIHLRKTAAIIRAAVRMGGICAGADPEALAALGEFGERLGLAFQATDDLLDATSSREALGKTPGKDAQARKRSYAAELGIPRTRQAIDELAQEALAALARLGGRADRLRELTLLLAQRDR